MLMEAAGAASAACAVRGASLLRPAAEPSSQAGATTSEDFVSASTAPSTLSTDTVISVRPDAEIAPLMNDVVRPLYAAFHVLLAAREKRGALEGFYGKPWPDSARNAMNMLLSNLSNRGVNLWRVSLTTTRSSGLATTLFGFWIIGGSLAL